MTRAYAQVIERLRGAVPEFGIVIDDHLAFYDEPLPHVLYGDLTRFVVAAHDRGESELVERCLSFLDAELREGDAETRNLVEASFVENIGPGDGAMGSFIGTWPAALQAEAERQRDWRSG